MRLSRRIVVALSAGLVTLLLGCSLALAVPITVNLRVEGSGRTLYEGPVTADGIEAAPGISTASSGGAHPCDVKDNGSNGGFGTASATPTTALYQAANTAGLAFDATWSSSFNDFLISQVGSDVNGGPPEFPSWGYAVNYTTAGVGGCQFQLAPGTEVLWAYNYFNLAHLLYLAGPTSAGAGVPFALHVTDAQTGAPISGASIGEVSGGVTSPVPGSGATDAGGNVAIVLGHTGAVTLKATRADSVRSNGVTVCVHNGNDGTCGTTVPTPEKPAGKGPPPVIAPDVAKVLGITSGHVYRRRSAPRLLSGLVVLGQGGTLRQVRIALQRRSGRRCFQFSGSRERFVRVRHCGAPRYFSVGSAASFSYLLPRRLGVGRYVFAVQGVEVGGRTTRLVDGVSRVSFRVR